MAKTPTIDVWICSGAGCTKILTKADLIPDFYKRPVCIECAWFPRRPSAPPKRPKRSMSWLWGQLPNC